MRRLPADSILSASSGMNDPGRFQSDLHFEPIRDGAFLPADFYKAFSEGKFNPVDFLGGWVTDEMTMFGIEKISKEDFTHRLRDLYGSRAEKLLSLLPHGDSAEATQSMVELERINFGVTSPYSMSLYNPKPDYLYEFSHVPVRKPGFPDFGAFHTAEVPYALHNLHEWNRPWQPVDYAVENKMSNYWIHFIRSGNPNGPGLFDWLPYRSGVILEIGDQIKAKNNLYKQLLETLVAE